MSSSRVLPKLSDDLTLQQLSDTEFVVKNRETRKFFSVGQVEYFLLGYLDGESTRSQLREGYARELGEPLDNADIDEFLELVKSQGFLADQPSSCSLSKQGSAESAAVASHPVAKKLWKGLKRLRSQNLLFVRVPLFDPDKVLNWIEPRIRWVWTRSFFFASLLMMAAALGISWTNRSELVETAVYSMGWETIVLFLGVVFVATLVHEMAHGLTCKHFGGEVREVGFLLMLMMPCMYCNVSDAWMIPEKSKRLWITAAGAFADLCMWAIGVICWRVLLPGSIPSQIAFVILTVCGSRGFLNLNPFLRLDGYYLLSDWLAIPNLRKRAKAYWMDHVRWMLWGAEKPRPQAHARVLLVYGIFYWCTALVFLDVVFLKMLKYLGDEFGVVATVFMLMLGAYATKRVFKGFFSSEFTKMIQLRKSRTMKWVMVLGIAAAVLFLLPVKHYATGHFEVRCGNMFQVHSKVSGYVQRVHVSDGDRVEAGELIAELRSPDMETQIVTKQAERKEVQAMLQKLQLGRRPEEVEEQRKRVQRLEEWLDFSLLDLEKAKAAHQRELVVLENRVTEFQAELELAESRLKRSRMLYEKGALAGEQLKREEVEISAARARVVEAEARLATAREQGVRSYEARVIAREQELAEARAELAIMEKGTRQEEIVAEQARLERIECELAHLEDLKTQLQVHAPVGGFVSAPRITEKIGQWIPMGALLCIVEDPSSSRVEISISEDRALGVSKGLPVDLKARAIPFETFHAKVESISSATAKSSNDPQSSVIVYCEVEDDDQRLKSGMTGFGRIARGWKTLGTIGTGKALRYLRTEFWW